MSLGGLVRAGAALAGKSGRLGPRVGVPSVLLREAGRLGAKIGKGGGRMFGQVGRFFGRNVGNLLNFGTGGLQLAGSLGTVQDEITVRVAGGPRSDNKTLFRLAAAVAFGRVKRLVPAGGANNPLPPPGMIGIHYSVEHREVLFMLRLNQSIMTITSLGEGADTISALPVFSGPSMTTVGGEFDFRVPTAPFAPKIQTPVLEFAGRVILTDQDVSPDPVTGVTGPTKNHRPSGDARSRGTLVRMVTAALSTPAEFGPSTFVLPNDTNRFTGG